MTLNRSEVLAENDAKGRLMADASTRKQEEFKADGAKAADGSVPTNEKPQWMLCGGSFKQDVAMTRTSTRQEGERCAREEREEARGRGRRERQEQGEQRQIS